MAAKKRRNKVLLFFQLLLLGIIAFVAVSFFYPNVSRLQHQNPLKTSFMEQREQDWRAKGIHREARVVFVPLREISPVTVKAILIAEDANFWEHDGFDFDAIAKAFTKNLRQRKFAAGGSTISQQLAKNLFLSPAKNPIRKIREAILTWRIERNLSKRRIVELYLNYAEWGNGIFGIERASHHHFNKSARELTAQEAAMLAAILPNPRRPLGHSAAKRAERIYRIMKLRGIVIEDFDDVNNSQSTEQQEDEQQSEEGEQQEQQN
ncbi:MAG: monofunctional biosynthetic peptidoglycan transglycosylase [Deltaproteobacteria bacterium]|nr:monofunctional biosynthetic peptidoglycan transglycosylase [Deltaproteobacteria bacterium]